MIFQQEDTVANLKYQVREFKVEIFYLMVGHQVVANFEALFDSFQHDRWEIYKIWGKNSVCRKFYCISFLEEICRRTHSIAYNSIRIENISLRMVQTFQKWWFCHQWQSASDSQKSLKMLKEGVKENSRQTQEDLAELLGDDRTTSQWMNDPERRTLGAVWPETERCGEMILYVLTAFRLVTTKRFLTSYRVWPWA